MPKIKQLSLHEAHKIAAGEVIERPANIVKELLENALDASATQISLYIEDGGKRLIRVVDNGWGMDEEDAHTCFNKYATSKITSIDELEAINTFGFRGEALASIAAVARITLITKQAEALAGIKVSAACSVITNTQPISAITGTDISIHDLFYTIPARKKFLKKQETEWRHIMHLFQAFCLTFPHIHFILYNEGTVIHNCPSVQSSIQRFTQLWQHHGLVSIENKRIDGTLSIAGSITTNNYRYDRNALFFFVNNRWVKNFTLAQALLKGYQGLVPPGKYPMACVNITIDPTLVDINIHPRKEEVAFMYPQKVTHLITTSVKEALEKQTSQQIGIVQGATHAPMSFKTDTTTPATFQANSAAPVSFRANTNAPLAFKEASYTDHHTGTPFTTNMRSFKHGTPPVFTPFDFEAFINNNTQPTTDNTSPAVDTSINAEKNISMPSPTSHVSSSHLSTTAPINAPHPLSTEQTITTSPTEINNTTQNIAYQTTLHIQNQTQSLYTIHNSLPSSSYAEPIEVQTYIHQRHDTLEEQTFSIIGQLHKTYILIEQEEGLFVVDQHAAHERILYEQFSTRFVDCATVQLLFPPIVTLSANDYATISPHLSLFKDNGITIEPFGANQLIISSTPVHLKNINLEEIVKQVVGWIHEQGSTDHTDFFKTINEKLHAQLACKAAIKAGDTLTYKQMHTLLTDLHKTPNRFTCPHGRPTGFLLSLNEIEKKVKRKK